MSPAKKKSEEVAVPNGGGLPDYMKGDEDLGRDQVDPEAIELSYILLLQGTSQMVKDRVEGAQVGGFADSVTKELFPYPVEFIPIVAKRKYAKRFWARGEAAKTENPEGNKGVECVSTDLTYGSLHGDCATSCPYKPPGSPNPDVPAWADWDGVRAAGWSAPKCSLCYEFAVLVKKEDGEWMEFPVVLSAYKSSTKVGKHIHNVFGKNKGALFSRVYELSSFEKPFAGSGESAYVMKADVKRLATEEEYVLAKSTFRQLEKMAWTVYKQGEYDEFDQEPPESSGDDYPEDWDK